MLTRIPQRTQDDCVTCVVAMVRRSYERVARDSQRYPNRTSDGKFYEWWVDYLEHEGLRECGIQAIHGYRIGAEVDRTLAKRERFHLSQ